MRLPMFYFFPFCGLAAAEKAWEDSWGWQHDLQVVRSALSWATLGSEFWSRYGVDCSGSHRFPFLLGQGRLM